MSDKNAKGKRAKGRKGGGDQSVLGSLPSTRTTRMGRRHEDTPAASATTATAKPRATTAKPKPKARAATAKSPTAAAKLRADAAKPRTGTATPRPAAAKPRAADRPRAVRAGSPSLKRPAPSSPPKRERPSGPPKGTELVTTAVQAAGELAQIGASISARMVKRAVDRIPKP